MLRKLALTARASINPMAAMFGGVVGQEVVKAASSKFHPLFQARARLAAQRDLFAGLLVLRAAEQLIQICCDCCCRELLARFAAGVPDTKPIPA